MSEQLPIMRQYLSLKRETPPGSVLFIALGDFFEAFGYDAYWASPIMGTSLTRRCGTAMTGFPRHASIAYLRKFAAAHLTVCIAEAAEVRRGTARYEITRIVSPDSESEQ